MALINVMPVSFMTLTPLKVSSHEQLIAFSQGVVSQYGFSDSVLKVKSTEEEIRNKIKTSGKCWEQSKTLVYNHSDVVMKLHYEQKPQFYNKMEGSPL